MLKKFKYSKKVWMRYHELALKKGDGSAAADLLRRSLQSLVKPKHVPVITHFAQVSRQAGGWGRMCSPTCVSRPPCPLVCLLSQSEFEHGSVDRGRTIFEGLISSYPRCLPAHCTTSQGLPPYSQTPPRRPLRPPPMPAPDPACLAGWLSHGVCAGGWTCGTCMWTRR